MERCDACDALPARLIVPHAPAWCANTAELACRVAATRHACTEILRLHFRISTV